MTRTISSIRQETENKMQKSVTALAQEFAKLRTGRAHPSILTGLMVDYYGQQTALQQVATVSVENARTLTVTPFEKNMVAIIDKVIREANLGLNPAVAGMVIRIPLPALTEDSRRALTKQMKHEAEQARISIRNARRDANNSTKELLKTKEISEDEDRRSQDDIQKLTDKYIKEIDHNSAVKEADLMKV